MPAGGARIVGVELAIGEAIERHGEAASRDHAEENANDFLPADGEAKKCSWMIYCCKHVCQRSDFSLAALGFGGALGCSECARAYGIGLEPPRHHGGERCEGEREHRVAESDELEEVAGGFRH